jgi:signal transduction histidine kinase
MLLMAMGVLVGFFSIRSLLFKVISIAKDNREALAPFLGMQTVKELNEGQNELVVLSQTFTAVTRQFEENINELKKKNEELQALDRLKDDFVNNVSHEFRLPLTIIQESIRQISEGMLGNINEEQSKYINMSLRNIDRLKALIDNMLDIAKIKKGKFELNKTDFDLGEVIKEVSSDFTQRTEKKGLTIKVDTGQGPLEVLADKDKITEVLINLVGNAYKFTAKGGIEITARKNNGSIECSVSDSGIGMSQQDLTYLFSDFYQIGRWDGHQEKGTGLGLVISKGIIELHNGMIHVESKEGLGTRFTFTLPVASKEKGSLP